MAAKPFKSVNVSRKGFARCLRKLPPDIRRLADEALVDLLKDPLPTRLDFKKLKIYRNPDIYSITIHGKHAYKMTMDISAEVAFLRRVASHRSIDDTP